MCRNTLGCKHTSRETCLVGGKNDSEKFPLFTSITAQFRQQKLILGESCSCCLTIGFVKKQICPLGPLSSLFSFLRFAAQQFGPKSYRSHQACLHQGYFQWIPKLWAPNKTAPAQLVSINHVVNKTCIAFLKVHKILAVIVVLSSTEMFCTPSY